MKGPTVGVNTLHAEFGDLTLENHYLAGALGKAGLLGGKRLNIGSPNRESYLSRF